MAAASRLTHGTGEAFSINVPLSGSAIESRNGSGNHTIVFTFDAPVNGGTATAAGVATVAGVTFSGNDMIVALSGVGDQQIVTVTASNVTGTNGATLASATARLGFLIGDVNGNGAVDAGDAISVRNRSGQSVDATNYRADVNRNGFVDVGDTTIVRSRAGNSVQ
jgi:hypothetical protein